MKKIFAMAILAIMSVSNVAFAETQSLYGISPEGVIWVAVEGITLARDGVEGRPPKVASSLDWNVRTEMKKSADGKYYIGLYKLELGETLPDDYEVDICFQVSSKDYVPQKWNNMRLWKFFDKRDWVPGEKGGHNLRITPTKIPDDLKVE